MESEQVAVSASPRAVDVADCAKEPIHIPGSIQPHGLLLAVAADDFRILQGSANAGIVLKAEVGAAIGRSLRDTLVDEALPLLAQLVPERVPDKGTALLGQVAVGGHCRHVIVHRADGALILEFEESDPAAGGSLDALYPRIRTFVDVLGSTPSIEETTAIAAAEVRHLTGFDRVLIYRFDEDWHGTVVAEDRNDRLPSYLDLRFPASDIPAQARELYRLNRLRLIPDADYVPVPILPVANPATGRPLDLSFSVLRSVSPLHLEYMRNMGTPASMSISIVVDGRLWGLISCHHAAPRKVPVHVRTACDFLGQVLAMQISATSRAADTALRVERQAIQTRLLAFMAAEDQFIHGLIKHPAELMALAGAEGAAVVFNGACALLGRTPGEARVRAIVDWLGRGQHDIFHTETLAAAMPGAEAFAETASGLLAIAISQLHPSYVLWFRPEVVRTVSWGGDPHKPVAAGADALRLHPRKSFEQWKETVRLRSLPWSGAEIDTAASLRNAIVGIVMRKAEELAQLTDELTRSNKELEAFSYSVSHDLRAPFRHIVGYAELLKSDDGVELNERGRRYLDTIIESAFSAGKLVDDLLGFSQMGRATLVPIRVDMNRLVDEVRRMIRPDLADRRVEWRIAELEPCWGDPGMLRLVIQNLLSNAVKYTRPRALARIEIGSERGAKETVYWVRDNGTGFDMAYVDKLFGVFQRLHRMEDFEGTGIGLANVRRIVERHGGRAWAEGEVDKGATFRFALPNQARE
ncbi:MAG: GAF domain-containing protein [Alphaproteobacteria bacterium]|jgi:light-regulated signal transduction histidine kinase (bacteriophytochrome)|nr:GAF domain-containing protein [Alphaproteobacteria bacterium]